MGASRHRSFAAGESCQCLAKLVEIDRLGEVRNKASFAGASLIFLLAVPGECDSAEP
jgi:hypothetical protein